MVTQVKGSVTAGIDADIATNTSDIGTINSTLGTYGTAATKDFGTAEGNLPEYQEEVVELGNNFTAGESVKVTKIGNVVTISSTTGALDHVSTDVAFSTDGVIPLWARPTSTTYNVFRAAGGYLYSARVTNSGQFVTDYSDLSAGALIRLNTNYPPTLSYCV